MKSKKMLVLFLGLIALLAACGHDAVTTSPPDTSPEPDENEIETTGVITAKKSYDPPYHVGEYIYTDKWTMKGDSGGRYLMYVTQETEIIDNAKIKVGAHVAVRLEHKKQKNPSRKYYIVWIRKLP